MGFIERNLPCYSWYIGHEPTQLHGNIVSWWLEQRTFQTWFCVSVSLFLTLAGTRCSRVQSNCLSLSFYTSKGLVALSSMWSDGAMKLNMVVLFSKCLHQFQASGHEEKNLYGLKITYYAHLHIFVFHPVQQLHMINYPNKNSRNPAWYLYFGLKEGMSAIFFTATITVKNQYSCLWDIFKRKKSWYLASST